MHLKKGSTVKVIDPKTWTVKHLGLDHPEVKLRNFEKNNKCFASWIGHVTAFAAIHAFGHIQHRYPFNADWKLAYLVSILGLVVLFLIFRMFGLCREWMKTQLPDHASRIDLWGKVSADKENDVCSLACSFLAVLAIRYALVHKLPDTDDGVVADPALAGWEMQWVLGLGLGWACTGSCALWFHHKSGFISCEDELSMVTRASALIHTFCFMTMTWLCLLTYKLFTRWLGWFPTCEVIDAWITIAVMASFGSFLFIFILDKIDDAQILGPRDDCDWMHKIITSMSLAVGFAWEQCFDTALDNFSEKLKVVFKFTKTQDSLVQFGATVTIIVIVLPACRFFVLPTIVAANEEKKKMDKLKLPHS